MFGSSCPFSTRLTMTTSCFSSGTIGGSATCTSNWLLAVSASSSTLFSALVMKRRLTLLP